LDEAEKPCNVEIADLTRKALLKFADYSDRKINIDVLKTGSYIVKVFNSKSSKSGILLKK